MANDGKLDKMTLLYVTEYFGCFDNDTWEFI